MNALIFNLFQRTSDQIEDYGTVLQEGKRALEELTWSQTETERGHWVTREGKG